MEGTHHHINRRNSIKSFFIHENNSKNYSEMLQDLRFMNDMLKLDGCEVGTLAVAALPSGTVLGEFKKANLILFFVSSHRHRYRLSTGMGIGHITV